MNKNIIYVTADPNDLVKGSVGCIFYRRGQKLFIIDQNDDETPIFLDGMSNFVRKKYNPDFHKHSTFSYHSEWETWIKISGDGKTGWKFVAFKPPVFNQKVVVWPTPTPSPTSTLIITPTPSSTPSSTSTPTPTSEVTPTPTITPESTSTPTPTSTPEATLTPTPTPSSVVYPKIVLNTGSVNLVDYINSKGTTMGTSFVSIGYIPTGSSSIIDLGLTQPVTTDSTYTFDSYSVLSSIPVNEYPISLVAEMKTSITASNVTTSIDLVTPHDNVVDAYTVPTSYDLVTINTTNVGSTAEAGEAPSNALSVWFKYTATESGSITIDTDTSNFDTIMSLELYSGATPEAATLAELTQLQSDDDSGLGSNSMITHAVDAGSTYFIRVYGYNGASGQISFHLRFTSVTAIVPPSGFPMPISIIENVDQSFTQNVYRLDIVKYEYRQIGVIQVDSLPPMYNDIEVIGEAEVDITPTFEMVIEPWSSDMTRPFGSTLVSGSSPMWVNYPKTVRNLPDSLFENIQMTGDIAYGMDDATMATASAEYIWTLGINTPYSSNINFNTSLPIFSQTGSIVRNTETNGTPKGTYGWTQGWAYNHIAGRVCDQNGSGRAQVGGLFRWIMSADVASPGWSTSSVYPIGHVDYNVVAQPLLHVNTGSMMDAFVGYNMATNREVIAYAYSDQTGMYSEALGIDTAVNGELVFNPYILTNQALYNSDLSFSSSSMARLPVYLFLVGSGYNGGYSPIRHIFNFETGSLDSGSCEFVTKMDVPGWEGNPVTCIKFTDTYLFADPVVTITERPIDPFAYVPPTTLAPNGDGLIKGFAKNDFNDVMWQVGLPTNGPASNGGLIVMSDDGRYVLAGGGDYDNPPALYVLERDSGNPEGFVRHDINVTGTDGIKDITRKFNQVGRNGVILGQVSVGGSPLSAIWRTGYANPPKVGMGQTDYLNLTVSGLFAFGQTTNGTGSRYNVDTDSSETINEAMGDPVAVDYSGNRVIDASNSDADNRYVLFTRDQSGNWTHDGAYLQAVTATGNVDEFWPNIYGMSGDASIVIGESSYKAIYWKMTDAPVGGVREAIALPSPADTATFGEAFAAEGISSDGSVIVGATSFGYNVYWTGPNFDQCHLLSTHLNTYGTGPQTIYDNATGVQIPGGSYNIGSWYKYLPQVGYEGRFVAVRGNKESMTSATTEAIGLVYASPTVKLKP